MKVFDLAILFIDNLHIFAIIIIVIALIYFISVLSIEIKTRYYLAIKNCMYELENEQSKKINA